MQAPPLFLSDGKFYEYIPVVQETNISLYGKSGNTSRVRNSQAFDFLVVPHLCEARYPTNA